MKRRGYGYTTNPTKITTSLNKNGNKHTFPSLSIYKTKTKASKKSKKSKETLEGIEMYDGGRNVKILEFQKTEKASSMFNVHLQWNISNPDTLGTEEIVLVSEVS